MPKLVNVTIHESQFPETVQQQLKDSLRLRQINHKFHYQTYRQTEKWHALHRAYAPSEKNRGETGIYEVAFQKIATVIRPAQVVGLCCGYAKKEVRLLQQFQASWPLTFVACDSSVPIVLRASEATAQVIRPENCHRLVCDLQAADDLPESLPTKPPGPRLFTFFGSVHNFEPNLIFPRLSSLLQPEDHLLFSVNLVPGPNPATGIMRIVPQYDNGLTFDWLAQLLSDLGLSKEDGIIEVRVEPCPTDDGLLRIIIYYVLEGDCAISVEGQSFDFHAGETLRLFYSYRYTPQKIREWLLRTQIKCLEEWVSPSGEEAIFLCTRQ